MKLTNYILSSAAAMAIAGTLSLAYAQTSAQGTRGVGSDATALPQPSGTTMPGTSTNSARPATTDSGTTATGTMNSQGATTTTRPANGTTTTNMNSDGSMTTERVARADRG